jgi:hypothetical protein
MTDKGQRRYSDEKKSMRLTKRKDRESQTLSLIRLTAFEIRISETETKCIEDVLERTRVKLTAAIAE